MDAGLSMIELAGIDVTRQTIFLIEKGKTKPSIRTLEIISRRTGKPFEYFLRSRRGSSIRLPGTHSSAQIET